VEIHIQTVYLQSLYTVIIPSNTLFIYYSY